MLKIDYSSKIVRLKTTLSTSLRLLKLIYSIDKWLLMGSALAIMIPAVIPFINMYIYKLVIDAVVKIASGELIFDPQEFYPLLALRIATYFIQDAAFRTQDFVERLLWTKAPIELNQMIFEKVASLDIHYFENDEFRNLLERVRESYRMRPQQLVENVLYTFQSLIQFSIAFVSIAKLNWFFIILISLVSIPEFINQTYQSQLSWGIWDAQSTLKKRFGYLSHLLQHHKEVKEVKMFSLAKRFLNEARSIQQSFYQDNKKLAKKSYLSSLIFNALSTGVFVGIEIFVIFQALLKKVTVGDINFYTGVVFHFQSGLGGLLRNVNKVFENSLYLKDIFDILDVESIIKKPAHPVVLKSPNKAPIIEFKNVTFTYPGTNKKILDNFSIIINSGEKIAFVGENGAGKSTIIKLLARFYDPDSGEVLINSVNLKSLDLDSWYQHIGVLFQDFNRYEDPVRENIYFGDIKQEMDLKKIINAATSAGAHKMVEKFEKGYETMLGRMFEGGIELSGGQWQKVALSRAFFRNAPVLVLDEPTASIDAKAESEIFTKVEKLSKSKTVIIISHRFSTVRSADKIYVIDEGKIKEAGTHEELLQLNGQYASLFKLQAKGYQ